MITEAEHSCIAASAWHPLIFFSLCASLLGFTPERQSACSTAVSLAAIAPCRAARFSSSRLSLGFRTQEAECLQHSCIAGCFAPCRAAYFLCAALKGFAPQEAELPQHSCTAACFWQACRLLIFFVPLSRVSHRKRQSTCSTAVSLAASGTLSGFLCVPLSWVSHPKGRVLQHSCIAGCNRTLSGCLLSFLDLL